MPSVSTNHLNNSSYKSSCILLFSLYTVTVLCTSLHLWTLLFCIYGLCYYYCCCCTVCTALLISYSAIFIAASVRNKLIHSTVRVRVRVTLTVEHYNASNSVQIGRYCETQSLERLQRKSIEFRDKTVL